MARPKAVKSRVSKRPLNFVLIFWVLLTSVISMISPLWYDLYFRLYMADLISSESVLSYPAVPMIESTTRVQVDKNRRQEPNNLDLLLMGKTPFQAPLAFLDDQPPLPWNTATRNIILKELQEAISSGTGSIAPRRVSVGNELGIISPDGTLVVPCGVSYMYWAGRQARLCDLLRNMTLKSSLDDHDHNFSSTRSGPAAAPATASLPPPLFNLTLDCTIRRPEGRGTGNWVTALYAVRMAVHLAKVDYQFQCDANDLLDKRHRHEILRWFEGHHPAPPVTIDKDGKAKKILWPYDEDHGTLPTEAQVCTFDYAELRIDRMQRAIQSDLRRMAVALVGPPPLPNHHNVYVPPPPPPPKEIALFPNITLDDVAIHFRCGDVMGGVPRPDYGVLHFSAYPKWIRHNGIAPHEVRRIGIVSQPFDKDRNRPGGDSHKTEDCRRATYLLVAYLQKHYPRAHISIHNGPNETLPLAFARLVMAKQTFSSLSTFGIFPVIGTFGEGYYQRGCATVNPFASHLKLPNVHEMTERFITSQKIKLLGVEAALEWLQQDDTGPNMSH